jgi:hypothetical protein
MRKVLISLAAAAATLAVAAPASAQWSNPAPGYGYGAPGYGYGAPAYGAGYGHMQRELQQIRVRADQLGRSGRLTRYEARDLFRDIRTAETVLYRASRNGLSPWEARAMQGRMEKLRYEMRRYADYDGRRYGRSYGYADRDWDHDRDWDRDRD